MTKSMFNFKIQRQVKILTLKYKIETIMEIFGLHMEDSIKPINFGMIL